MIRRLLMIGLGAVLGLSVATAARADFVTSDGSVYVKAGSVGPPLLTIQDLSADGGHVFTNQVSGLTPFAVGSTINTIGFFHIGSALDDTNFGITLPDGSQLTAAFGIQGTIISNDGLGHVVAKFDKGGAFLESQSTGNPSTFDQYHPATWNFGANTFANFALLPQTNVIDGSTLGINPAGNVSAAAAQTNVSAVNTVTQQQQQGIFLFYANGGGPGASNPGLGSHFGDNFITNVKAPDGGTTTNVGIASFVNQTALSSVPTGVGADASNLSLADLAALNAIAAASGFGSFATGFGAGPSTNYDPQGIGLSNTSGDFVANITADNYIGVAPEPSSLVLMGMGVMAGIVHLRRRRAKQALAADAC